MKIKKLKQQRNGKVITAKNWSACFCDHRGAYRRLSVCSDKGVTQKFGDRLSELVSMRRAGMRDLPANLLPWIESLPERTLTKLIDWDLISQRHAASLTPLPELLSTWKQSIIDGGSTAKYAQLVYSRAERVLIDELGYHSFAQIDANAVSERLVIMSRPVLDEDGNIEDKGISKQTANHYVRSAKQFTRWMVSTERAQRDPLTALKQSKIKPQDMRHGRRVISLDEFGDLVAAAQNGPDYEGMSGSDRALVYQLLFETGMRRGEVERLTPAGCRLDGARPHIELHKTKSGTVQTIPLDPKSSLIPMLKQRIGLRLNTAEPLFELAEKTGQMVKVDLERAGIPYRDENGRVFDFHSIRGLFISALVGSGASISALRSLARHANVQTTLSHYARLTSDEERAAISRLPRFKTADYPQTGCHGDADEAPQQRHKPA